MINISFLKIINCNNIHSFVIYTIQKQSIMSYLKCHVNYVDSSTEYDIKNIDCNSINEFDEKNCNINITETGVSKIMKYGYPTMCKFNSDTNLITHISSDNNIKYTCYCDEIKKEYDYEPYMTPTMIWIIISGFVVIGLISSYIYYSKVYKIYKLGKTSLRNNNTLQEIEIQKQQK